MLQMQISDLQFQAHPLKFESSAKQGRGCAPTGYPDSIESANSFMKAALMATPKGSELHFAK